MEKVGVEAVVEGLSAFVSDIGRLNSSLKSIEPSGNIVSRTLEGVSSWFGKLGESMLRVAEIALGVLVRDAFLAIVNGLKEMISATIEAGSEFQTLQLRLSRLNFNAFMEGKQAALDYLNTTKDITEEERKWGTQALMASVMEETTQATQEQLKWVQRLAATTPYDFQDIANVFTLARSYGFADTAARGLTQDISNFAAGMGLGNTEIERIIINMGQMVQQGKVTQRELNDLARGAFVPVNDVIKRMQENTGLAGKEFDKFKTSGEGVNAFMNAFSQIVQERFQGASEQMARTFKGATDNVKDFIKSIFGFGVVTPILDVIGGKIADVLSVLTSPANFDAISSATQNLGTSISGFLSDLLNLEGFDANAIADKIIEGINKAATWIDTNGPRIIDFFGKVKDTIRDVIAAVKSGDFTGFLEALGFDTSIIDKIINFKDAIMGVFDQIRGWIDANQPLIDEFFGTLGEIVGTVIQNLTGAEIDTSGGITSILDGITKFMQFVVDNKDDIAQFVTDLAKLWGVMQIIGLVASIVLPPILAVVGAFLGFVSAVSGLIAVILLLTSPLAIIIAGMALLGLTIGALIGFMIKLAENWDTVLPILQEKWYVFIQLITDKVIELKENLAEKWQEIIQLITDKVLELKERVLEKFNEMKTAVTNINWAQLGKDIISGIKQGVLDAAQSLIDSVKGVAQRALDAVQGILGIQSPSKVFAKLGKNMMEGWAHGIEKAQGLAIGAMQEAAFNVAAPAVSMGGAVSTHNNYTNNWNLTVNSSASSESVVQDYNMLKSLSGA